MTCWKLLLLLCCCCCGLDVYIDCWQQHIAQRDSAQEMPRDELKLELEYPVYFYN